MQELKGKIEDFKARVSTALVRLDVANREKEVLELEKQSLSPDFWQDQDRAQAVMRRIADSRRIIDTWRKMEKQLDDISELLFLAEEDKDSTLATEVQNELEETGKQLDEMEFELVFSGRYDNRNAILSIHAGAGGTESQDWAEMLLRMYLRWAEKRDFKADVLDTSLGEEAGIKSVVVAVTGDHAFGYLRSEHGVHRLVRLSPFDADHARHTSFAMVEVIPEAESNVDVIIKPEDIKIEVFRSSGPGGQHMQKSSTAVRITHLPSGITVVSQSERSQLQNKTIAMKILEARLFEKDLERQAEEKARLKGKHVEAGWGNQIRSYVLHPYKMIKDHRTDYQSANPEAVLEGEPDDFMIAYLRSGLDREND
ncbi:MAG: peptide chain release factor 2 [Dehalococcoidales bacterium]|nr:peptide chain release factor 2 [Dehalococcoidales bacterium]